jgi:hypothetical protein
MKDHLKELTVDKEKKCETLGLMVGVRDMRFCEPGCFLFVLLIDGDMN